MGEDTSYDIKNQNLIDRLDGVPKEKRTARFVCAIAAVLPDGENLIARQTMEGYIGWEIEGKNGFGYDPIFYLDEYGCSSASLTPQQKNEISHRGKALRDMKEPVSYTHLDVYKRQDNNRIRSRTTVWMCFKDAWKGASIWNRRSVIYADTKGL